MLWARKKNFNLRNKKKTEYLQMSKKIFSKIRNANLLTRRDFLNFGENTSQSHFLRISWFQLFLKEIIKDYARVRRNSHPFENYLLVHSIQHAIIKDEHVNSCKLRTRYLKNLIFKIRFIALLFSFPFLNNSMFWKFSTSINFFLQVTP